LNPTVRIIWDIPHHAIRRVVMMDYEEKPQEYDKQALRLLFERIRRGLSGDVGHKRLRRSMLGKSVKNERRRKHKK
jgi:hypothetical protein